MVYTHRTPARSKSIAQRHTSLRSRFGIGGAEWSSNIIFMIAISIDHHTLKFSFLGKVQVGRSDVFLAGISKDGPWTLDLFCDNGWQNL